MGGVSHACRDCDREFPTAGLLIGHAQAEGHCSVVPAGDPREADRAYREAVRVDAEAASWDGGAPC